MIFLSSTTDCHELIKIPEVSFSLQIVALCDIIEIPLEEKRITSPSTFFLGLPDQCLVKLKTKHRFVSIYI